MAIEPVSEETFKKAIEANRDEETGYVPTGVLRKALGWTPQEFDGMLQSLAQRKSIVIDKDNDSVAWLYKAPPAISTDTNGFDVSHKKDNVVKTPLIDRLIDLVTEDKAYLNAVKNSDEQTARLELSNRLKKIATTLFHDAIMAGDRDAIDFWKQWNDGSHDFRNWLEDEVFERTYPKDNVAKESSKEPQNHEDTSPNPVEKPIASGKSIRHQCGPIKTASSIRLTISATSPRRPTGHSSRRSLPTPCRMTVCTRSTPWRTTPSRM